MPETSAATRPTILGPCLVSVPMALSCLVLFLGCWADTTVDDISPASPNTCHTVINPSALVYEVMQELYHQL